MNDHLHTVDYKGFKICIDTDDDPQDPREWDNATVMWCFHPRYNFGDTKGKCGNPWKWHQAREEFQGRWEELEQAVTERAKPLAIAELYLYDHSTQTIKIGSFAGMLPEGHAHFDTMPVGWIMVTKESYEMCCGKVPHKGSRKYADFEKHCQTIMEQDVAAYNDYLHGSCYCWHVEDADDEDGYWVAGCGGVYLGEKESYDSDDNCMIAEAKAAIDAEIEDRAKKAKEESDAVQKKFETDFALTP